MVGVLSGGGGTVNPSKITCYFFGQGGPFGLSCKNIYFALSLTAEHEE